MKEGMPTEEGSPLSTNCLFLTTYSIGIENCTDEGNDVNLRRVVIFVNV
jgi:hypothetical protein